MPQNKRIWYGLDLFKFCAAVLIVFLHTYNSDWGFTGLWIKEVLSRAGVPFFFLTSGFLLRYGIDKALEQGGEEGEKRWFGKYMSRLIKIYAAWSIITLPIAFLIVNRGHPNYGILMKIAYHFRLFFFTGSVGFLWYILALIISAVIIHWFYRKKRTGLLVFISILLFLWGCAYDSPLNKQQPYFEILHIVFGSTRNFLNVGLFYMLAGFLFPMPQVSTVSGIKRYLPVVLLLASILIRSFELTFLKTGFTTMLVAFSVFLVALSFDYRCIAPLSLELRKLSIGLYLLHVPFILSFDFYLTRGTIIDFPLSLIFSFVTYYLLTRLAPKISSLLFGY